MEKYHSGLNHFVLFLLCHQLRLTIYSYIHNGIIENRRWFLDWAIRFAHKLLHCFEQKKQNMKFTCRQQRSYKLLPLLMEEWTTSSLDQEHYVFQVSMQCVKSLFKWSSSWSWWSIFRRWRCCWLWRLHPNPCFTV